MWIDRDWPKGDWQVWNGLRQKAAVPTIFVFDRCRPTFAGRRVKRQDRKQMLERMSAGRRRTTFETDSAFL